MKSPFSCTVLLLAMSLCLCASAQRTINVPADKPTIQAAIDSSANGDTVLVAAGTYYENLNFRGRNITVASTSGPSATVLDGSHAAPVVTFASGEASLAALSGFTIRNGTGPTSSMNGGGGVYIHYASPTIANNVFTDNDCTSINVQGSPTITGNTITRTHTFSPLIQCEFPGTAILLFGSTRAHISGNSITGNTEGGAGVVLAWASEDTVIENNVFRDNRPVSGTFGCGGAICMFNSSSITIDGNEIYNNGNGVQSNDATAIYLALVDLSLPGQQPLGAPLVRILNNTIANNGTGDRPQVLITYAHARIQVANNVVSSNNGATGFDCRLNAAYATQGNTPVFVTNDSFTAGQPYTSDCGADSAHGNVIADPQLVADADGHPVPHAAIALNTGSNSVLPQPINDLEGNPRAQGAAPVTIDLGAIETASTSTAPQVRMVAAPSRYQAGTGPVTVTYAYVSNASPGAINVPVTLYVDGVAAQTQAANIVNGPPEYSGSFSITLSPGRHELQVRYNPGAIDETDSIPTRVYGTSAQDASPMVIMEVDPQTAIGPRISGQVRCRLTQSASGRMRIFDNGNLLVDTVPNGTSDVYATFFADSGPHQYECDFESLSFNDSVVASQVISSSLPSSGGLYSLPDPSEYGDPVTIGGSIQPYTAGTGGHLRITEGQTVILDKDLDSTGNASIVTTTLTPGLHTFQGVLTSTSGNISNTNGSFTQTVHFAPTTLALAASPVSASTAATITLTTTASSSYTGAPLTGSVDILDNGTKLGIGGILNGTVTLPAGTLAAGTHSVTAVYKGTDIFASATSNAVTVTVHREPTRITLAATPLSGTVFNAITLTMNTTSNVPGTPITGTVDLFDGAAKLSVPGTLNGTVTLPAGTLGGGTHTLTAVYNGSTIFDPATSNPVTITLIVPPPPDFSITPATPKLTVQTEHHATAALTLTSLNNFSGNVRLSCSNLPLVATCTFDKSAYALSTTAAVSFVVETSAIAGFKAQLQSRASTIALCLLPAGLLLLGLPRRSRVALSALAALLALAGCSGKYPDHTPPGAYTVTITATGASGGTTVTHTVPFTLTVTPE